MTGALIDNVGGITTTTTTGAYQGFSAWGQADPFSSAPNDTYAYKAIPYPVTPAEPTEYETGEGTWNGSTLTRDTVKTSSDGGSAVDWTGQRVLVFFVADSDMLSNLDLMTSGSLPNARLANMGDATLKGRASGAGTGTPTDLTAAQARTILNVEDGATADQTGAEIKALYEGEADTNAFTDAEQTKVGHISVTQAVDLDQMETDIAALANGMVYKGDWDPTSGVFPGAGAAQTGWFYYVSNDGTVDSVTFNQGDNLVATTDNASTTTYAGNWSKHDQTDAVQSVAGLTGTISASALRGAINVADGANNYTHPNHTGDVTSSGDGATTIANNAVTNAKAADMAQATIKGRADAAGTGDPQDLTPAQARTAMDVPSNSEAVLQGGPLTQDLDADNNAILDIDYLDISGSATTFSSQPPAFISQTDDHTYDFANALIPAALHFGGTHTFNQNPFVLGMGQLFSITVTIQNEDGEARTFPSFLVLNNTAVTRSVNAASTAVSTSFVDNPGYSTSGTGTMTVGALTHYFSKGRVLDSGVTMTKHVGFHADAPTITGGTVTSQAGFIANMSGATNNTQFLIGTDTIPSGDYGAYQGDESVNRWNAGQEWKVDASAATSLTLDDTHHIVSFSSTSTVTATLPAASDGKREYVIKKTGASGTINVNRAGSDTIDGGTTVALSTQYHLLRLVSDGTSAWHILHNGAP